MTELLNEESADCSSPAFIGLVDEVLVAIAKVLVPGEVGRALRAAPVPAIAQRLATAAAEGLHHRLRGCIAGVRVAGRQARWVLAMAVDVVRLLGRLEVAVDQLELVAAGPGPRPEAPDLQGAP